MDNPSPQFHKSPSTPARLGLDGGGSKGPGQARCGPSHAGSPHPAPCPAPCPTPTPPRAPVVGGGEGGHGRGGRGPPRGPCTGVQGGRQLGRGGLVQQAVRLGAGAGSGAAPEAGHDGGRDGCGCGCRGGGRPCGRVAPVQGDGCTGQHCLRCAPSQGGSDNQLACTHTIASHGHTLKRPRGEESPSDPESGCPKTSDFSTKSLGLDSGTVRTGRRGAVGWVVAKGGREQGSHSPVTGAGSAGVEGADSTASTPVLLCRGWREDLFFRRPEPSTLRVHAGAKQETSRRDGRTTAAARPTCPPARPPLLLPSTTTPHT